MTNTLGPMCFENYILLCEDFNCITRRPTRDILLVAYGTLVGCGGLKLEVSNVPAVPCRAVLRFFHAMPDPFT